MTKYVILCGVEEMPTKTDGSTFILAFLLLHTNCLGTYFGINFGIGTLFNVVCLSPKVAVFRLGVQSLQICHSSQGLNILHTKSVFQSLFQSLSQSEGTNIAPGLPQFLAGSKRGYIWHHKKLLYPHLRPKSLNLSFNIKNLS